MGRRNPQLEEALAGGRRRPHGTRTARYTCVTPPGSPAAFRVLCPRPSLPCRPAGGYGPASGLMPPPDLPFWALSSSSTDFQGPLLPDFRFPASTWQSSTEQDLSLAGVRRENRVGVRRENGAGALLGVLLKEDRGPALLLFLCTVATPRGRGPNVPQC